jgi:5'(3')-deoxyribonucleotidase
VKLGIDLDDVMAICAVPYLRRFAEEYRVDLPDEREIGWHLLRDMDPYVSAEERDRFRVKLYDGTFFSELEVYADCPAVLERLVNAGYELYFVTARAERRRFVTETWLREKGLLDYAKAVHLRPMGDFRPDFPRGRYDASSSAEYKTRLAKELALDAFCEDDVVIARTLAGAGVWVFLFEQPWNREVAEERITRVSGWSDLAERLGV